MGETTGTLQSLVSRLEDERKVLVAELNDLTETDENGPNGAWNAHKRDLFDMKFARVDTIDARIADTLRQSDEVAQNKPCLLYTSPSPRD